MAGAADDERQGGERAAARAEAELAAEAAAPSADQLADARFEDIVTPARLVARDGENLSALSALLQDAALLSGDIAWLRAERRFAFVANRYRWEEPDALERVRCGVHAEGVLAVRVRGLDPAVKSRPMAVLALQFTPSGAEEDPSGVLRVTLSGGAAIEVDVEALEVALKDLTRPWRARRRPAHALDAD